MNSIRNLALSCRAAVQGMASDQGDRVAMFHPMVPSAWPHGGPALNVGIPLQYTVVSRDCLESQSIINDVLYIKHT